MGPRVRRLRKQRGWTQEELAEKVSVAVLTVGEWERENQAPATANLMKLSEALGVPVHYLLYGEAGVYREAVEQIADIIDRVLTSPPAGVGRAEAAAVAAAKGKPDPTKTG
jgi:transcriptional regulator with XRE-family HTH domain